METIESTGRFGGNDVRVFGTMPSESFVLADDAYRYEIVALAGGETRRIAGLATGAVWVLQGAGMTAVHPTATIEAQAGHAVLFEGDGLELRAGSMPAVLLVSGTKAAAERDPSLRVCGISDLHRVEKPWGEELWINGRHPTFAFKRIVLRAGQRTSLQYHDFKRETNLLVDGSARLHFNTVAREHAGPYQSAPLDAVSVIDVTPKVLHRIEAVTDVTLFEVSTPHLDDVIRVSDDTNRVDGLIASEHAAGAVRA